MTENLYKRINDFTNVSRETFQRLEDFVQELEHWNKSHNLIGRNEENIWERHIFDSCQLASYIPQDTKTINDFGSGGGLPGLVLGTIFSTIQIHLIESNQKKSVFLEHIASKYSNISVHNCRIETLPAWGSDLITARALAPLPRLFNMLHEFINKSKKCLFLKGKNVVEEIEIAKEEWNFSYFIHPNLVHRDGVVLEIENLKKRG